MKTFISIIVAAFMLYLAQGAYAQGTCGVSPLGGFCEGRTIQYYAGGRWDPQVTLSPANAGVVVSSSGLNFTITWSNSFVTSGCSRNDVRITVANADGSNSCTTDAGLIIIHKKPTLSITGNPTISPVNSWTNEYQTTTYTVSGSCFSSISSWTMPSGWNIVSASGSSIDVKPEPGATCSGIIKAKVQYGNGCTEDVPITVSLNPLAYSTITNHLQTTGTWPPLEICPTDDIILDAHMSNFCNANQNIFLEWTVCNSSWTPMSASGAWLTPPQYSALGGLSYLNIRTFLANHLGLLNPPPGFYKLKLAVGNGLLWNERNMHIEIKPPSGIPAPGSFAAMNATPKGAGSSTAQAMWNGNTSDFYEIIYETSDSPLFPHPGTITSSTGCFNTTLTFGPPNVYTFISGLPLGHHFRYKIRECPCGTWTPWSNIVQLQPAMDIKEINGQKNLDISVAPNPFSENLTIIFDLLSETDVTIRMIDITGRQVKLVNAKKYNVGENRVNISTADFAAGLYQVIVTTNTGSYIHKVLCNK